MSGRLPELRSFYCSLADEPSQQVSADVQALARALMTAGLPGLTDVVPGYTNVMLEYDSNVTTEWRLRAAVNSVEALQPEPSGRLLSVPVRYDGPDLESSATALRLTSAELVRRHSAAEYLVHAIGFTPGFPYLGLLELGLRLPRREQPRGSVPANSVAMADSQTGIYPLESPGGWHLLGTALEAVYRPGSENPFLLEPGDRVRFTPGDGPDPLAPAVRELLPEQPHTPLLKVLESGLLDLIVDAGRLNVGRYGLARSGAMDQVSSAIANRLLGNPPLAPLLEVSIIGPTVEVLRDSVVAFAGWGVRMRIGAEDVAPFTSHYVRAGEVLSFPPQPQGVRGYLAVPGGFEVNSHLGSASPDIRGLVGRKLRAGDVLGQTGSLSGVAGRSFTPHWNPARTTVIRLLRGPQFNAEAAAALAAGTFLVGASDRMGVQLDGPTVPGGQVTSEGSPLGAVQVTPGGRPIILLNDRGTLGGYAKPAVVHPADLPRLAQLREQQRVRFVFVDGP